MFKILRRKFGYTAYTWGNNKTNGHIQTNESKKNGGIGIIESLKGQIKKIEFSSKHAAAITEDGRLFMWGDKKYGKLGLSGVNEDTVLTPKEVTFFTKNNIKIKDCVLGKNHTIVLDTEGKVYSFGKGNFSKNFIANFLFSEFVALGHPKAEHVTKPQQIMKLQGIPVGQISTGNHFSMALAQNGDLMVWGRGEFGVLGCGNKQIPEPIVNPVVNKMCQELNLSISKIRSCDDFSSILVSDGSVLSFGNNDQGIMGIGKGIGVDLYEVVNMPTHMEFLDGDKQIVDLDISEKCGIFLTDERKLYQTGQKLFFNPELIDFDYSSSKIKSFAAFSKGLGFVTEDNNIYTKGGFWPNADQIDEDLNTGISKINHGSIFGNKEIVEIGFRFGETKHLLVKE